MRSRRPPGASPSPPNRPSAAGHSRAAPKSRCMRNRALHDALRNFALEAAALLTDDLKAGAEVEFDVVDEGGGRGPALYRYEPRTGAFLTERWPRLRELPACAQACEELGAGASAWLRVNGLSGEQAEPALQAMLERLYEDSTSFGFPEERFDRVYREVEVTLYRDAVRARVMAPLRGAWMEAERVELGDGLSLVRGDRFEGPHERSELLCVLERDVPADDPIPTEEAADRFAAVITAMRLWLPGGVILGAPGWRQTDQGRWQPLPLGSGATPAGGEWMLAGGRRAGVPRVLRGHRRRAPARHGRLGARPLRDGLRARDGGAGALRLPARAARPAGRHHGGGAGEPGAAARGALRRGGRPARRSASPRGRACARALRDGRRHRAAPRRGVATRAGGGGGEPPARAAARRALRLPRRRPQGRGRRHPGGGRPGAVHGAGVPRDRGARPAQGATLRARAGDRARACAAALPRLRPRRRVRARTRLRAGADYEAELDAEPDTAELEAVTVAPEPVQHELDGVTQSVDFGWDDPEDFSAPV